jgi:hypothetical protein
MRDDIAVIINNWLKSVGINPIYAITIFVGLILLV